MFLTSKTPLVAVDIGAYSIKVAQLAGEKNKFELLNFAILPLKEGCVEDGVVKRYDEVVEALSQMIKAEKIETKYAVASIAGEAVIIKKIRVPRMSPDELAESIYQIAEQYIPFDIDDVSLDFQILDANTLHGENEEDDGKMEILLVAVQRDIVDNRADLLFDAGLRPAIIDLDAFAMANAFELGMNSKPTGVSAFVDLGESYTHLNILQNGITAYTRDIPIGGSYCTKKLMSTFNLPYQEVAEVKRGTLPPEVESGEVADIIIRSFEKILEEIGKSFEFFSTTSNSSVEKVVLSGGGALIPGVDGLFSQKLNSPVEIWNPFDGIKVNKRKFNQAAMEELAPLSAVAIGLASRRFDYQ